MTHEYPLTSEPEEVTRSHTDTTHMPLTSLKLYTFHSVPQIS